MKKLSDMTIDGPSVGIAALVVAGTAAGYLVYSQVNKILSPDSKAPASEQAKQPLLEQYGNRHQDAAQMLERALNGK